MGTRVANAISTATPSAAVRLQNADLQAFRLARPRRETPDADACGNGPTISARLLAEVRPTASDSILVNTGDDFALLALANAMKRAEVPPTAHRCALSFCPL